MVSSVSLSFSLSISLSLSLSLCPLSPLYSFTFKIIYLFIFGYTRPSLLTMSWATEFNFWWRGCIWSSSHSGSSGQREVVGQGNLPTKPWAWSPEHSSSPLSWWPTSWPPFLYTDPESSRLQLLLHSPFCLSILFLDHRNFILVVELVSFTFFLFSCFLIKVIFTEVSTFLLKLHQCFLILSDFFFTTLLLLLL